MWLAASYSLLRLSLSLRAGPSVLIEMGKKKRKQRKKKFSRLFSASDSVKHGDADEHGVQDKSIQPVM